jgi:hypothetical protein
MESLTPLKTRQREPAGTIRFFVPISPLAAR